MMSWSDNIWECEIPQYKRILRHPFICGLADGSLKPEKFARYLAQDELYVPMYCSLMHRLAEMLPESGDKAFMHGFADAGGESEQAMHKLLIERFSVCTDVQPSVVTASYFNMLENAVRSGNAAVATAAMLPCSWVYNNVGIHIAGIAHLDGNPYREWISEYGNEDYGRTVLHMVAIADKLAAAATSSDRARMDRAFISAMRHEYAFWDYAYHGDASDYSYLKEK